MFDFDSEVFDPNIVGRRKRWRRRRRTKQGIFANNFFSKIWNKGKSNTRPSTLARFDRKPSQAEYSVILVHGVFSNCRDCFDTLAPTLSANDMDVWFFDYDWKLAFEDNADSLLSDIRNCSDLCENVVIIGHSMGGLIARIALIKGQLDNISALFTIATPNYGAFTLGQLKTLGSMIFGVTRTIAPTYLFPPSVSNLLQADQIISQTINNLNSAEKSNLGQAIQSTRFASVPAQFYHDTRSITDMPPSWYMFFVSSAVSVLNNLLGKQIGQIRPVHDGIVEENSNKLVPQPMGCITEFHYLNDRSDFQKNVAHLNHVLGAENDHITILKSQEFCEAICGLVNASDLHQENIDNAMGNFPLTVTRIS